MNNLPPSPPEPPHRAADKTTDTASRSVEITGAAPGPVTSGDKATVASDHPDARHLTVANLQRQGVRELNSSHPGML